MESARHPLAESTLDLAIPKPQRRLAPRSAEEREGPTRAFLSERHRLVAPERDRARVETEDGALWAAMGLWRGWGVEGGGRSKNGRMQE